jgi:hypothetical protein
MIQVLVEEWTGINERIMDIQGQNWKASKHDRDNCLARINDHFGLEKATTFTIHDVPESSLKKGEEHYSDEPTRPPTSKLYASNASTLHSRKQQHEEYQHRSEKRDSESERGRKIKAETERDSKRTDVHRKHERRSRSRSLIPPVFNNIFRSFRRYSPPPKEKHSVSHPRHSRSKSQDPQLTKKEIRKKQNKFRDRLERKQDAYVGIVYNQESTPIEQGSEVNPAELMEWNISYGPHDRILPRKAKN